MVDCADGATSNSVPQLKQATRRLVWVAAAPLAAAALAVAALVAAGFFAASSSR
jgi:hypothetical protein